MTALSLILYLPSIALIAAYANHAGKSDAWWFTGTALFTLLWCFISISLI